jgi:GntR family transcriptional regulator/MocR family aminotransferase
MDLAINLDSNGSLPLHRQLYAELRQGILTGRLLPNQRLPSSRSLARALGISRFTVTQCYEQLIAEGYLQTTVGSGTFVNSQLPDDLLLSKPIDSIEQRNKFPIKLSVYGNHLTQVNASGVIEPDLEINFRYGRPALDQFPLKLWRKLLSRHCLSNSNWLDYSSDLLGYQPLREAIARYLKTARAVKCQPEQIIITHGSQQGIELVTRLLINPGEAIALENPCYLAARYIFQTHRAKLLPIPVDESGLIVPELFNTSSLKLVYVTPSHQFPTGVVLSLSRRLQLLSWAQETGAVILEDDYDSEYRYNSRPIPALQGLDPSNSVIYLGTFSKVLFPSLRIGYLVVPNNLVDLFARARWLADRHNPLLEQKVLTDFINEGHLERHIRRMRHLYDRRRQVLVQALKSYLGDKVKILGENAGIHLTIQINTSLSDKEIIEAAAKIGVGLTTARNYYLESSSQGEFLLGYSQLDEKQIEEGICRFSKVVVELNQR